MISQNLTHIIESHADEISRRWLRTVREHPDTITYHNFPESKLLGRVRNVYEHLSDWIEDESTRGRIEEVYVNLGKERYEEGFKLSEVIKTIMIARRTLAAYVDEQGLFDSATDLIQIIDLTRSVNLFFDRCIYHTIRGYEKEAHLAKKIHS